MYSSSGSKGSIIASSAMGVTIFDLFGEIFSENDMINFLKENGIDPNGLIGGGLAIRCFLLLKVPVQID